MFKWKVMFSGKFQCGLIFRVAKNTSFENGLTKGCSVVIICGHTGKKKP